MNRPQNHKEEPHSYQTGLETPVQFCPGVGPKRALLLNRLGIETIRDLFWHLPRAYEDYHTLVPIRNLSPGAVATVAGTVTQVEDRRPRSLSKVRHIFQVLVEDQTGAIYAVWFNQPFLAEKIRRGENLLLHGKAELYDQFLQMSAPKFQIVGKTETETSGILPLYPLCEGLTQSVVRKIIKNAWERFGAFCQEFLPENILAAHHFPRRLDGFLALHFPQPQQGAPTDVIIPEENLLLLAEPQTESVLFPALKGSSEPESLWERARRRLIFEEFFLHQFILCRYRGVIKKAQGIQHPLPSPNPFANEFTEIASPNTANAGELPGQKDIAIVEETHPCTWPARFLQHLPFALTPDQWQVCREIQADLCSPNPTNRLLQGDVGSGKTVVCFYAAMVAIGGGHQAALMVPTEILANQHEAVIRRLTQSLPGLNIVTLTGSAKTAETRKTLSAIADGTAHLVIGTHALFQERVEFARLGLVIVDEQHKFGVLQRQRLVEKGLQPDLLVVTATPIPRTLSLTLYGDMDVSLIRSQPPGRPPITTRWTTWEQEKKVWEFVDQKIALGQQVYVVCPIIEPSENIPQLPSTEESFERISQTFLPHRRVEILHGRHSMEIKEDRMERMRAGEIDVVVATTVIEVGVDLPNASIMVVLGAERFGLAQLHQLRGRVGRGTVPSYCILVTTDPLSPQAEQRMKIMEQTRDGFVIAEADMKLRGAGDFFGTRQSGHLRFRLADLFQDGDILRDARKAAEEIYQADAELRKPEHQLLRAEVLLAYGRHEFTRPS